ncbi:MAG: tRNA 2-thiocytidine biosynthesis protein TtcA [Spirochaetales bacterium]|nr:tRNA 2-thiocytidine biosynthesis protein TtcA [Spirochaetales bacterium]
MTEAEYRELFAKVPPRLMRFIKKTGRGINQHKMFGENDKIIISLSAGKDSLALALALALRKKWLPVDYQLEAVQVDWTEYPMSEEQSQNIRNFCAALDIPYTAIKESMFPGDYKDDFNCYRCSRNRRRIIFNYAAEKGYRLIATGHHLDDLSETVLMNLVLRGRLEPMQPVSEFFDGKITVIRPMCLVEEKEIIRITKEFQLPVAEINCPYKTLNMRYKFKPILREFVQLDKHAKNHIYQAFFDKKNQSNKVL